MNGTYDYTDASNLHLTGTYTIIPDITNNRFTLSISETITNLKGYTITSGSTIAEHSIFKYDGSVHFIKDINNNSHFGEITLTSNLPSGGSISRTTSTVYNLNSDGTTGDGDVYLDNIYTSSLKIGVIKISNGHIKINNTWKNAFAWFKTSTGWKRCIIWKKINGVWKKGK